MCGIYAIGDIDGRIYYVGKSKDIEKRVEQHKREIRKGETKLYTILKGLAALITLEFWLLEEVKEDKLNIEESYWIRKIEPILNTQVPEGGKRFIDRVNSVADAVVIADLEANGWMYECGMWLDDFEG